MTFQWCGHLLLISGVDCGVTIVSTCAYYTFLYAQHDKRKIILRNYFALLC